MEIGPKWMGKLLKRLIIIQLELCNHPGLGEASNALSMHWSKLNSRWQEAVHGWYTLFTKCDMIVISEQNCHDYAEGEPLQCNVAKMAQDKSQREQKIFAFPY